MVERDPGRMMKLKIGKSASVKSSDRVYTLRVYLLAGPVTKEFEGKEISRIIQIKGNQTLKDLHRAIFRAYDRWEEHFYEFNLGKGPYDRSCIYSLPSRVAVFEGNEKIGDVTKTTINSLGLRVDRAFGYWFDFGDDWVHQINVIRIGRPSGKKRYPRIIKRVGKSPPQYPDIDEDEQG